MGTAQTSGAAEKVYVPPGKHDEFYNIVSGGFSGNVSVYGLPSGRLFREIPVFSADPGVRLGLQRGNQADAEHLARSMPWDDSTTSPSRDQGRARRALGLRQCQQHAARGPHQPETFRTEEIIEMPNSSGNHSSPFLTENTEYIVAGTRFAVPLCGRGRQSRRADQLLQGELQVHDQLHLAWLRRPAA